MKDKNNRVIRAGSTTYFLDIKQTRDGQPYLLITESRFKGEGIEHERKSIIVFKDKVQEFSRGITELATFVK